MYIVDNEFVSASDGGFHKFLVRWKDHPPNDNIWLTEAKHQLAPYLLKGYLLHSSLESSSFHPREMMVNVEIIYTDIVGINIKIKY